MQDAGEDRCGINNPLPVRPDRQDPHLEGVFIWDGVNQVAEVEIAILRQYELAQLLPGLRPFQTEKGRRGYQFEQFRWPRSQPTAARIGAEALFERIRVDAEEPDEVRYR